MDWYPHLINASLIEEEQLLQRSIFQQTRDLDKILIIIRVEDYIISNYDPNLERLEQQWSETENEIFPG